MLVKENLIVCEMDLVLSVVGSCVVAILKIKFIIYNNHLRKCSHLNVIITFMKYFFIYSQNNYLKCMI